MCEFSWKELNSIVYDKKLQKSSHYPPKLHDTLHENFSILKIFCTECYKQKLSLKKLYLKKNYIIS